MYRLCKENSCRKKSEVQSDKYSNIQMHMIKSMNYWIIFWCWQYLVYSFIFLWVKWTMKGLRIKLSDLIRTVRGLMWSSRFFRKKLSTSYAYFFCFQNGSRTFFRTMVEQWLVLSGICIALKKGICSKLLIEASRQASKPVANTTVEPQGRYLFAWNHMETGQMVNTI